MATKAHLRHEDGPSWPFTGMRVETTPAGLVLPLLGSVLSTPFLTHASASIKSNIFRLFFVSFFSQSSRSSKRIGELGRRFNISANGRCDVFLAVMRRGGRRMAHVCLSEECLREHISRTITASG